ncbi:MAG TPA: VOC family protein [Acidimicrobiales bacterium]|nr:VOC family protein [Acidimicrobiales bacterium]
MTVHRLTSVTVGVPDVAATVAFYEEFGLTRSSPGVLASRDGGDQLRLVPAERRRLVTLGLGVEDPDDLDRIARDVAGLGLAVDRGPDSVRVVDPGTGVEVVAVVDEPIVSAGAYDVPAANAPGRWDREHARSSALDRDGPVQPRKLGHVVVGSTDSDLSHRLFVDGLGFRVSDHVEGVASFLRCSTDHHNVLVQTAPTPFLHHTSWQVDDVDEIGRGARALLDVDPGRDVWGLGRHHIGSNYFWYFRDPAGNFAEYYSDLDVIVDDELWKPETFNDMRGLYAWGPAVPAEFLLPDDIAELLTGS